jgi:hypothetical protein
MGVRRRNASIKRPATRVSVGIPSFCAMRTNDDEIEAEKIETPSA